MVNASLEVIWRELCEFSTATIQGFGIWQLASASWNCDLETKTIGHSALQFEKLRETVWADANRISIARTKVCRLFRRSWWGEATLILQQGCSLAQLRLERSYNSKVLPFSLRKACKESLGLKQLWTQQNTHQMLLSGNLSFSALGEQHCHECRLGPDIIATWPPSYFFFCAFLILSSWLIWRMRGEADKLIHISVYVASQRY